MQYSRTPLMEAVIHDKYELADVLIEARADITDEDEVSRLQVVFFGVWLERIFFSVRMGTTVRVMTEHEG